MNITEANAALADHLEKAADLLESGTLDWCQRATALLTSPTARVCAWGALMAVELNTTSAHVILGADKYDQSFACAFRLERHIDPRGEGVPLGLAGWNDTPGRTKQEVIDLFKEVAKDLRNDSGR